ncbi:MAG: hypothetical protein FWE88_01385 [Phycisphaerae bacterium]|nr:hypothetical protein [Phycisphaerae bacterium]
MGKKSFLSKLNDLFDDPPGPRKPPRNIEKVKEYLGKDKSDSPPSDGGDDSGGGDSDGGDLDLDC